MFGGFSYILSFTSLLDIGLLTLPLFSIDFLLFLLNSVRSTVVYFFLLIAPAKVSNISETAKHFHTIFFFYLSDNQ